VNLRYGPLLNVINIGSDVELFIGAEHKVHPLDGGGFFLSQLCVASHYGDEGVRVIMDELTDRLPALSVSSLGDGTCVDDIDICMAVR